MVEETDSRNRPAVAGHSLVIELILAFALHTNFAWLFINFIVITTAFAVFTVFTMFAALLWTM